MASAVPRRPRQGSCGPSRTELGVRAVNAGARALAGRRASIYPELHRNSRKHERRAPLAGPTAIHTKLATRLGCQSLGIAIAVVVVVVVAGNVVVVGLARSRRRFQSGDVRARLDPSRTRKNTRRLAHNNGLPLRLVSRRAVARKLFSNQSSSPRRASSSSSFSFSSFLLPPHHPIPFHSIPFQRRAALEAVKAARTTCSATRKSQTGFGRLIEPQHLSQRKLAATGAGSGRPFDGRPVGASLPVSLRKLNSAALVNPAERARALPAPTICLVGALQRRQRLSRQPS